MIPEPSWTLYIFWASLTLNPPPASTPYGCCGAVTIRLHHLSPHLDYVPLPLLAAAFEKPNQQVLFHLCSNGCIFMWGACFCFGATSFPYTVLSWATTHATELTFIVILLVLRWGQPNRGESCIMVESGPIRSCVVKLLQCSLLAVSKFHIASKEHCEPDNAQVCAEFCCRMSWCLKHIRMITAMYVSSVYFRFTTQEFSMIGGYIKDLRNRPEKFQN